MPSHTASGNIGFAKKISRAHDVLQKKAILNPHLRFQPTVSNQNMTITLLSYIITLLAMSTPAQSIPKVLVYTATAGYRHDSIPTAIQVLGDQQASYNVSFTFTEYVHLATFLIRDSGLEVSVCKMVCELMGV